ncbi:DUF3644 domain-containing protein [Cellulomonas xiejunii]|uniref:DUF3644 domain-containing protein n=1 Tax=Cellulomonas xiejunii TaxID=2968083 RepID=A0ABY5KR52_9CELL|nr:DUF3644 domain-containing protein [Cellulomonas xiejunii]MCC2322290.1 hypothetical protein [Cellulomonas xiejunii]UUI72343.1 hypothetical protein NP048_02410 [Cellulomonas xiejunii]
MAPRPRWWHILQTSKNEVRLAVDIYNRSGNERQLEAFIVHMTLGWLKLLQARVDEQGGDLIQRDARNWRRKHPEGGWLYKPLRTLLRDVLDETDPRVANINFFVGLRNQIEHRHEAKIASVVAGRTQALLLNYETTLVEFFGTDEALGTELRFPLFVSSITQDATAALRTLRAQVPRGVLDWIQDFDAALEPGITAEQKFDFRIYLIPHTGPKTDADAAMTFVHADQLTPEQNAVVEQVQTIIREKKVPVEDLNGLLPKAVVDAVDTAIERPFTLHMHTQAWRYFQVRPAADAPNAAATKSDFCRYNPAFRQYVYTPQWVTYLIRHLSDPTTYDAIMAHQVVGMREGRDDPDLSIR